jgi:hypothetical protein
VTGPSHRPLPDNTQHSQETDIHAPGGILTRNSSKQAAADPRLRSCSHSNRPLSFMLAQNHFESLFSMTLLSSCFQNHTPVQTIYNLVYLHIILFGKTKRYRAREVSRISHLKKNVQICLNTLANYWNVWFKNSMQIITNLWCLYFALNDCYSETGILKYKEDVHGNVLDRPFTWTRSTNQAASKFFLSCIFIFNTSVYV